MKSLRQYFYVLNLLFVVELILTLFFVSFVKKSAVISNKPPKLLAPNLDIFKTPELAKVPLGQIYGKRDIFGIEQSSSVTQQAKSVAPANIPELVIPEIPKAPAPPSIDFVNPLSITLNGIVGSLDPNHSVCIIADEADKEATYKVGDRIKDGLIIKILRDRVVILRLNGQIETFFLHEMSVPQPVTELGSFVMASEDGKFKIDTEKFRHKVVNLGGFLDHFDVVPFVGEDGKVIGLVVTDKDPKSFASLLGFKENDLILSIDGISLTSNKERLKAYDQIISKPENADFVVEFERDGTRLKNSYVLATPKLMRASNNQGLAATNGKSSSLTMVPQNTPQKEKNTSKIVFPELLSEEERKKNESLYQGNINRIRQEMLARMQRNN